MSALARVAVLLATLEPLELLRPWKYLLMFPVEGSKAGQAHVSQMVDIDLVAFDLDAHPARSKIIRPPLPPIEMACLRAPRRESETSGSAWR